MGHKLESADRVGDTLEIVALSVSEVIHRIGVPFGACAMMRSMDDAIHHRVAEVHVGISHVELCPEHHRAFYCLGSVHLLEEGEVFLNGSVAIWACLSRCCRRTFLLGNLLRCLLVDICHSLLDHPHGEVPQLLEIVAGVIYVAPFESEPLYVVEDRVNIFSIFLRGICVVKSQVAHAAISLSDAKVHADGLGMSDVNISVGLWRESCLDSATVFTLGQVGLNHLFHEAQAFLLFVFFNLLFCHICVFFIIFGAKIMYLIDISK